MGKKCAHMNEGKSPVGCYEHGWKKQGSRKTPGDDKTEWREMLRRLESPRIDQNPHSVAETLIRIM